MIARQQGSNWHYYHFDELGSTRLLTDGGGNVADRYAYDAWGKVIAHDKHTNSIDQPYQYVGRLGYYTHYQDPEFGLLQLGVRYYDPKIGKFSQRDRLRVDGVSNYLYANDTPVLGVDPSGMRCIYIHRWKQSPKMLVGTKLIGSYGSLNVDTKPSNLKGMVTLECNFEWNEEQTWSYQKWEVTVEVCKFLCFTMREKEMGEVPGTRRTKIKTIRKHRKESFSMIAVEADKMRYDEICQLEGLKRRQIPVTPDVFWQ